MRILHTSDWHLGKQLRGFSLVEDQVYVLDEIHRQLKDLKLDCIVISGDIYDRPIPPTEAVSLFDETLTRLRKDFKKPVLIVSGNHDSAERLNFGSTLFSEAGVSLYALPVGKPRPLIISDQHGEVALCPVPYLEPAVARDIFKREDIHSHEAAMVQACESFRAQLKPGQRSVLIAHAFVAGGEISESERPLSVGGTDAISPGIFAGFNYVALGHLHKAQHVQMENLRYSGSPLKYSQSEMGHAKSCSIIEIDGQGGVSIEALPLKPKRDLRLVSGYFKDLLERKVEKGSDDYVVLELLDSEHIFDPVGRLRDLFPRIIKLSIPERTRQLQAGAISHDDIQKKTFVDLFKTFVERVDSVKLGEAHLSFLAGVAQTVKSEEGGN